MLRGRRSREATRQEARSVSLPGGERCAHRQGPARRDARLRTEALDGKEKAQHDMRIAAKRLRYVLEVTGFCFGKPADTARRRARDLQDILGEIHDCDVMLPRVRRHLEEIQKRDAGRSGRRPRARPTSTRGSPPGHLTGPPIAASTCSRSISRPVGDCSTIALPPSGSGRRRGEPGTGSSGRWRATCAGPARRAGRRRQRRPGPRRRRRSGRHARPRPRPRQARRDRERARRQAGNTPDAVSSSGPHAAPDAPTPGLSPPSTAVGDR